MNDFEYERERTRSEVANYFRQLADGLDGNDKLTLVFGEQSVAMNPPQTLHFRVETDTDSSWLSGDDGRSVHIELGWDGSQVEEDDDLTIVQQKSRGHQGSQSQHTDSDDAHGTRHDSDDSSLTR